MVDTWPTNEISRCDLSPTPSTPIFNKVIFVYFVILFILDFKAYLKKLQDASEVGFDELCNRANQLQPEIPPLVMRKKGNFVDIDENAQRGIPTGKLSGEYIAIRTYVDGNSLFRAASVLAFGDESKHPEMRVRTVVELACNKSYYITFRNRKERLRAQEQFMQLKSSRYVRDNWSGEFDKDVRGTCKESLWVSDFHLQALPTVFQRSVKIVSRAGSGMYLNDVTHPRHGYSKLEPLVIMWISSQASEEMLLSHFVPLVPVGEVCSFGKGKLKIIPIVFAQCLFFIQEKRFCLAVIFRTDLFFPSDCFLVTLVKIFFCDPTIITISAS